MSTPRSQLVEGDVLEVKQALPSTEGLQSVEGQRVLVEGIGSQVLTALAVQVEGNRLGNRLGCAQ